MLTIDNIQKTARIELESENDDSPTIIKLDILLADITHKEETFKPEVLTLVVDGETYERWNHCFPLSLPGETEMTHHTGYRFFIVRGVLVRIIRGEKENETQRANKVRAYGRLAELEGGGG